jgi:hypothetical protein
VEVIYKVDSRRRTYGELWRIHRPHVGRFLLAATNKLFDVVEPCAFGVRRPDRINIHWPRYLANARAC